MNNIGEQHRDLLVLRRSPDLCDRCTALVTELGVQWQLRATRPTEQPRRGQSTVPPGVHISIVSPLLSDVRHIAALPPTRSLRPSFVWYETYARSRHTGRHHDGVKRQHAAGPLRVLAIRPSPRRRAWADSLPETDCTASSLGSCTHTPAT